MTYLGITVKYLGSIVGLALATAVSLSPVAQGAAPVRGVWSGTETQYWTGSGWQRYTEHPSLGFRVERRQVLSFGTVSAYVWPRCAGGETARAKLPTIGKARVRHGRFRGTRTTHEGSRRITAYVSGRFTSARRARGHLVLKLAGCPAYRSTWAASSGVLGGIHIPICRGQNVMLADGTYYYNPCAYIA